MFGSKLIVKHHRPVGKPLLLLTFAALLVLVAFLAYVYGTATLSIKYASARKAKDEATVRIAELQAENKALAERVTLLERASQVDRQAYEDVDDHLRALQMEIFALKEEVAFYRGIVSSTRKTGFNIQSFEVRPDAEQSGYHYQLVLTNDMHNDQVISGTVTVLVSGEQNGRSRELSSEDLWPDTNHGIVFRLKHFQKVEGRFVLPDGFAPHSVTIHVVGADDDGLVAERTFTWPQAVS